MAHPEQRKFVEETKEKYNKYFANVTVLDIGSLNVNGTFKDLFTESNYTGVDITEGRNVDVVAKGHEFKSKTKYDVVCSGECFEHDEYYEKTLKNMYSLLKNNGLFFFTCATTGRPEHGTTRTTGKSIWGTSNDYYKNLTESDIRKALDVKLFSDYEFIVNQSSHDIYFRGIKSNKGNKNDKE